MEPANETTETVGSVGSLTFFGGVVLLGKGTLALHLRTAVQRGRCAVCGITVALISMSLLALVLVH